MNDTVVKYDDNESVGDIQIVRDGDSDADMMSVTGMSMAGLSDGGSIVNINQSQKSGSMYSGSDVQVVR